MPNDVVKRAIGLLPIDYSAPEGVPVGTPPVVEPVPDPTPLESLQEEVIASLRREVEQHEAAARGENV